MVLIGGCLALVWKVGFGESFKRNRPLVLVKYTHTAIHSVAINGNSVSSITAPSGRQQVYCGHVEHGQTTSVSNVFACGDAARAAGNLTLAVADGRMVCGASNSAENEDSGLDGRNQ